MLYGHSMIQESASDEFAPELVQEMVSYIAYDDLTHVSSDQIQEFCNSEIADVMLEKKIFDAKVMRKTRSKESDLNRRIKIAAYTLAKEDGDAHFKKMCMYRQKMKEERQVVLKKYAPRAKKLAMKGQKEYIKAARKGPAPEKASKIVDAKTTIEKE